MRHELCQQMMDRKTVEAISGLTVDELIALGLLAVGLCITDHEITECYLAWSAEWLSGRDRSVESLDMIDREFEPYYCIEASGGVASGWMEAAYDMIIAIYQLKRNEYTDGIDGYKPEEYSSLALDSVYNTLAFARKTAKCNIDTLIRKAIKQERKAQENAS